MGYEFARWLIQCMFKLVARVRVVGMEHVPVSGGFIIASNHIGRLDAPLVYYLLNRRDVVMMVAEKYKQYAFYRWFAKRLDALWIDRFNADMATVREALKRLKRGGVLVVAPEGTRSKTGKLQEARPGVSFLAAKSGALVIPVGVVGTEDRQVVARLRRLRRIDITLYVGQPFIVPPLAHNDRESALQAATDEIMCQIAALLPESARGIYHDHPRLRELLNSATPSQA